MKREEEHSYRPEMFPNRFCRHEEEGKSEVDIYPR